MPAGIQRLISGISSRMRSTVSMTLASALLVMVSRIAGWPLNMAAERELRVPCSTLATSDRRTTLPFAVLTTMLLVVLDACAAGRWSRARWPAWSPSMMPSGASALALAMAVRTSSMLRPIGATAASG